MAVYMVSDTHLGLILGDKTPKEREKRFVDWLISIQKDCTRLMLVGDIFDFFFEWKRVVPKGYVRTLATLASMCEKGIEVDFFPGNHDLWVTDYLTLELGITVQREPLVEVIEGKKFFISHGDQHVDLNFLDDLISVTFRSAIARAIGSRLIHPDFLMRFGLTWSRHNRLKRGGVAHIFGGEEDFLVKFSRKYLEKVDPTIDYFVFGHEHTPLIYPLNPSTKVVILGEWIEHPVVGRIQESDNQGEVVLLSV